MLINLQLNFFRLVLGKKESLHKTKIRISLVIRVTYMLVFFFFLVNVLNGWWIIQHLVSVADLQILMSFLNLTSHTTLYYFCIFISGKGFISKIYSLIYYLLVITAIFFSIHNYLLLHQCRKNFISYGLKLCDLLASFLMRSKSELLLTAGFKVLIQMRLVFRCFLVAVFTACKISVFLYCCVEW